MEHLHSYTPTKFLMYLFNKRISENIATLYWHSLIRKCHSSKIVQCRILSQYSVIETISFSKIFKVYWLNKILRLMNYIRLFKNKWLNALYIRTDGREIFAPSIATTNATCLPLWLLASRRSVTFQNKRHVREDRP